VAVKLNAHPDVTWYKVEAENHESIHNHNAYATIEKRRPNRRRGTIGPS
jgi:GTP cyclohydrolase IB